MKNKKYIGLLTIILVLLSIWLYNKRLPLISSAIVKSSEISFKYQESKYTIEVPEVNIPDYSKGNCEDIDMTFFSRREFRERKKTEYGINTSNNTFYKIDVYSNEDYLSSMVFHTDTANRIVYIKLDYMYSNSSVRYEEEMYFDSETGLISHYFRKYKYNSGFFNDHGYTAVNQIHTIVCGDKIIKSVHSNSESNNVDIHTKDIINGRNIIKSVYGMRALSNKIAEQIEPQTIKRSVFYKDSLEEKIKNTRPAHR